ncbi:polyprenyl synthetase family protein, partial [Pseudomonas sp.]
MISTYQATCQARVDGALNSLFTAPAPELARLYEAMRYSVMNGGKRVRPLLVYAACEALGTPAEQANGAACAVELIHAYSLVHDDLPAMDDDDLRRGQPTTHKAFDEACAILAGDGLQSLAFAALLDDRLSPQNEALRLQMAMVLANAAGPAGMVGGQAIDLGSV